MDFDLRFNGWDSEFILLLSSDFSSVPVHRARGEDYFMNEKSKIGQEGLP